MPTEAEIQARVEQEFAPLFRCLDDVQNLFDAVANAPQPALSVTRHNVGVGLLVRGSATFQSLLRLATRGFGQDAFFLARSLFEAMVSAKYLGAHPAEIEDYWSFGFARQRRWIERLVAEGQAAPTQLIPFQTTVSDTVVARFSNDRGRLRDSWNGKSLADLAEIVGEKARYLWLHGPASNAGHGQVTSLLPYFTQDPTGAPILDMKPSTTFVDLALGAALPTAVELCAGVTEVLSVATPEIQTRIEALRSALSAAFAELATRQSGRP